MLPPFRLLESLLCKDDDAADRLCGRFGISLSKCHAATAACHEHAADRAAAHCGSEVAHGSSVAAYTKPVWSLLYGKSGF